MRKDILKHILREHRKNGKIKIQPSSLTESLIEREESDLFELESRGLLKINKTSHSDGSMINSIELTQKGTKFLEEDDKGRIYKLGKWWKSQKDGRQFIRNIILTIVTLVLLYLYRSRGIEINDLYDIVDQLKND